ncbi:MAG: DNA cytosine methyltransferase [Chthoniobacterales bacterium]
MKHISILDPEIVIMENVYGLKQIKSSNVLAEINHTFEEIGYEVTHKELLSADFGTPQMKKRLIFVATKGMNDFSFPIPTHAPESDMFGSKRHCGARDSFSHLPPPQVYKKMPNKSIELISLPLRSIDAVHLNTRRRA